MLRIISHIERLLLEYDCVIIPKVGGFVLQDHPSVFVENKNLFSPAHKEVTFNPTLQHNDGLLVESYMKMYHVDYNQAFFMVEEDTDQLKAALSYHQRISLGSIGQFLIGEEERVIFERGEEAFFSPASYGLGEFHLPTLQTLQQETARTEMSPSTRKKKKDTIYIPVSVRFIRTAVASAAAIALFLLISTPVRDVNTSAYTASFIPSEVVAKATLPEVKAEEPVSEPVASSVTAIEKANEGSVNVSLSTPSNEVKEAAAIKKNIKYYHAVIGSFPTQKQADSFLAGVDKTQCADPGIVERNGRIRVYAARFTERNEAENYINKIRTQAKYKDAWLFISR
ncbi:HU domain-containing protein [Parabacteroides pacaensis]|uniref:HU domain-containing protein n=1 Tax=Parabacteroides pacaensis TaxID=2086575 RepID=UPI000D0EFDD7|nr:SPOR domain-containing protein [Parabacteroides pacaensis]